VSARRESQVTDSLANAAGNLQHLHYASMSSTTFLDHFGGTARAAPAPEQLRVGGRAGRSLGGRGRPGLVQRMRLAQQLAAGLQLRGALVGRRRLRAAGRGGARAVARCSSAAMSQGWLV